MSKTGGQATRAALTFLREHRVLGFQFHQEEYLAEVTGAKPDDIELVGNNYLKLTSVADRFFHGNIQGAKKAASAHNESLGYRPL